MRRIPLLVSAILLFMTSYCCSPGWSQKPAGKPKKADESRYRLKPHLDRSSGTGFYIPHDLTEAFHELDKMISPALRAEIQQSGENDIFKHYRFGLGLWMRNNWGLWKRLRLAQYFVNQGIKGPESMSLTILRSYWRYLNHKPIGLAEQVKAYQDYARQAKIAQAKEEQRVVEAKASIAAMMLGMEVENTSVPALTFDARETGKIRVRYMAPFGDGFLIAARENLPVTGIRGDGADHFISPCYFWDGVQSSLQPINISGMSRLDGVVVVGDTAYFSGVAAKAEVIRSLQGSKHRTLPTPPAKGSLRLGIEKGSDGTDHLLAVRPHGVYRWRDEQWQVVYSGKRTLPDCVVPPRLIDGRLYFRDEGAGENDKRLSWLDISNADSLTYFDENVAVVGPSGPRWENVWDFASTPDGTLWLATGTDNQSLLVWNPQQGYRIALFNDGTKFLGSFWGKTSSWQRGEGSLAATGLLAESDGMYAIGPRGVFRIVGRQIHAVLEFANCPEYWTPTHLIKRGDGSFLAGGHWGGVFLLEKDKQEGYHAIALDAKIGLALQW